MKQTEEWWVEISHAFNAHVREEVGILEAYEQLCETVDDEGIRYLLRLILDDEHRHHQLFEDLAAAARDDDPDAVPPPPRPRGDRELLAQTQRFLEIEREDYDHLVELRKKLRPAADDTLWRLLVELMQLDTEKHIRILEYLTSRLK